MSHFAVMVIGDDVNRQLAPFHEFECTGQDDEFVQDIDKTEEYREEYKKATTTMIRCPDGSIVSRYTPEGNHKPEFCREEEDEFVKGMKRNRSFTPPGHAEVEVPTKQFETFAEWSHGWYGLNVVKHGEPLDRGESGKHKYGHIQLGPDGEVVKIIERTNPNKKWDWYQIGGRYSDSLLLKSNATTGEKGERSWVNRAEEEKPGRADSALKRDIDIEGMRDEAGKEAAKCWDTAGAAIAPHLPMKTWREYFKAVEDGVIINHDDARRLYHEQPAVKAFDEVSNANREMFGFFDSAERYAIPREQFIANARNAATAFYAVLKNGQWHSKGDMGWFGMSNDKLTDEQWAEQVNKLIDELPDDTRITIVDCHI